MDTTTEGQSNRRARIALVPDPTIVEISSAAAGWWAIVQREDGTRTSVPVACFALLTDSRSLTTWIEAVTADEFAMSGALAVDERVVDFAFDPRPSTFEKYLRARRAEVTP